MNASAPQAYSFILAHLLVSVGIKTFTASLLFLWYWDFRRASTDKISNESGMFENIDKIG